MIGEYLVLRFLLASISCSSLFKLSVILMPCSPLPCSVPNSPLHKLIVSLSVGISLGLMAFEKPTELSYRFQVHFGLFHFLNKLNQACYKPLGPGWCAVSFGIAYLLFAAFNEFLLYDLACVHCT